MTTVAQDSYRKFFSTCAFVTLALFAQVAQAVPHCVLPVPDGGGVIPTRANLTGIVSAVGAGFVEVRPFKGGTSFRVLHDSTTEYYSAFGGDYEPADLAVGQRVWIWFVNCKRPVTGQPKAAYLQLFSRDPSDQPRT